jgi:hypothetical protein
MKRIFLIGNGPSLNQTPLDLLIGEDTFALNRIHLIYPRTKWRPTYFWYVDHQSGDRNWRAPIDINRDIAKHMWLLSDYKEGKPSGMGNAVEDFIVENAVGDIPNTTWIPRCRKHTYYGVGMKQSLKEWHLPEVCTAYNSMSGMTQVAYMLGYEEIYYVGCDLGYQFDFRKNYFDPDYAFVPPNEMIQAYCMQSDQLHATVAHRLNKQECYKRNIKTVNATVGGELEIYPRVRLEDVL